MEFLDPIEQGLDKKAFMSRIKEVIEIRSNELIKEAGIDGIPQNNLRT